MDRLPAFAPDLFDLLDTEFPGSSLAPSDTESEAWMKAGARRLINALLEFQREQQERREQSGLSVDPASDSLDEPCDEVSYEDAEITEGEDYEPVSVQLPFGSSRLIRMLDIEYPERPRDPNDSDHVIWMRAGERRLIECLKERVRNSSPSLVNQSPE